MAAHSNPDPKTYPGWFAEDSSHVAHIGKDRAEIEQETGSRALPLSQESLNRPDAFLNFYKDVVIHDDPAPDPKH